MRTKTSMVIMILSKELLCHLFCPLWEADTDNTSQVRFQCYNVWIHSVYKQLAIGWHHYIYWEIIIGFVKSSWQTTHTHACTVIYTHHAYTLDQRQTHIYMCSMWQSTLIAPVIHTFGTCVCVCVCVHAFVLTCAYVTACVYDNSNTLGKSLH